jgi:glycosyltransferase involved in cell wall biosynthesis
MRICTIVARNYLGQAEVLAESFLEHHPSGAVSVLVVDDRDRLVESKPGLYDLLRPEDLPIPRFDGMAAMYDITELCTAVKPWLLRHLLDKGGEPIAYFDPDICFYGGVGELFDLARGRQIVLTPHMTNPFPDDAHRPSSQHVLAAGAYNLGFIALGPGEASTELLDWWSARLRFDCIVDVRNDYFVDQRWFDLVPGMFPVTALVHDPGINVAYWNLHERELRAGSDGRLLVGDAPLKFFHFSGFDPRSPVELSRHQTRFRLRETPVLADLCSDYAKRVIAHAPRFGETRWPFDKLADGRPLTHILRRLYREGERAGAFELSPFTIEGTEEFIAWLAEVAPDAPGEGINRYWTYIYRNRPDLQVAFPALAGADGERYLQWIVHHAPVDAESRGLIPRQSGPQPGNDHHAETEPVFSSPADEDEPVWGVNVAGYMESEVGVGEAARAAISALDAARIPLLPVHGPWRPEIRQGHRFTTFRPQDAVFPVNLLCVNADMTERWLAEAGPGFRAGRYTIGLWWWEVTAWPEQWLGAFDLVDEVWVATDHIHAALAPVATVPVTKITLPVRAPTPRLRTRADLGLPEGFLFLFMFDYCSIVERKNPFDVIEAFIRAFDSGEGATLAIKCINQDADPTAHERLRLAAAHHPDIHIIEGYVSAADKNSMMASADCYVSLHRSEGFGLTLAESLLLGKPVIATRYGGNLDFMAADASWLVDAEMVPIGSGNEPYPAGGEWAQPDVAQASRYMREIFEDPAAARERSARGAAAIRRTHSPQAAGATMAARLELLRGRRDMWPQRAAAGLVEIDVAASLLSRGPTPTRENPGAARSAIRQSALRVMKPYTAFERQIDDALLGAVRALRAIDERIEARLGQQVGVVTAALREVEFSIAELTAQVSASSDATADWLHGLRDSQRGVEGHFAALESDIGARLTELTDRIAQAELRLKQLEAPALVSDRARFASLAALHRAHAEIDGRANGASRADRLEGYELRGFSQNGEDGVLAEILGRIGVENRFFVEFGIESGREGNCVYLADVAGWDGLFIEAHPDLYRELSERYAGHSRVSTLQAHVTPENVEQLFADAGVPESFDILSVDVDGSDYWIWEALESFRPRIVVIEYNSALPAHSRLVQPRDHGGWEGTNFQGASLGAMTRLAGQKGYRLVHTETSGVNAFFVADQLAGTHFPAPESIPERDPNYFQIGYHHPPDSNGHRYLNLDTGELVHSPVNGSRPS